MSRLLSRQRKKHTQNPGFVFRGKQREAPPALATDERQQLIDQWLSTHEPKKLPAAWSHYGWGPVTT